MYPRTIGFGILGLWLLILAGCGDSSGISRDVPAPEEMVLLSIDLKRLSISELNKNQQGLKYGEYPVLGTVKIEDEATRKDIMNLIQTGFNRTVKDRPKCFNPRHVVRVKNKSSTADFVICLECSSTITKGDPKDFGIDPKEGGFRLSWFETRRLNAPLVKEGIPLAPN